jgi:hypothetical protein
LAAASSAQAGELTAAEAAINATALVIIRTFEAQIFEVLGPFLLSKRRMLFLRCSD